MKFVSADMLQLLEGQLANWKHRADSTLDALEQVKAERMVSRYEARIADIQKLDSERGVCQ